jgi:hypothetical protein
MHRLGLVLAILIGGCSTTTFDFAQSQGTERWLRERAPDDMRVTELTEPPAESDATLIESTSLTRLSFKTKDERIIPLEQVRRVVVVKRGWGALTGALIGTAVGATVGVMLGYAEPLNGYEASMDCTIVCSKNDAAKVGGLMYGALGLLVGTIVGAIVGQRDILDLR